MGNDNKAEDRPARADVEQDSLSREPRVEEEGEDKSAAHEGTPRREFLKRATVASTALILAPRLFADGGFNVLAQGSGGGTTAAGTGAAEAVAVRLRVNGQNYGLKLDPRVTLLDLMRERLDLPGTKKGCDQGQCGACTVLIDGRRINSCLALAVAYDGSEITTVEGLARGEQLHPVQAAFITHDGFQCGYCTPGQICSAIGMLREVEQGQASHVTADVRRKEKVELTDDEIRERMSGNICRCGAYPGIVAAVKSAHEANGVAARNTPRTVGGEGR